MEASTPGIEFDRAAAVVGLVVALALLPVQLFISHIYAQTLPPVLALACLVYLAARGQGHDTDTIRMPTWLAHLLPSVVVFGTAGLALLAHSQGGRTQEFYVLASLLGTLVLGQLLFTRDRDLHVGIVLGQVFVLAAVVRWAAVFTTPGYIGIDAWIHMAQFTRGVLEAHSIAGMGQTKYLMAPLYHLLVVVTSLFTGLGLRWSLFLSLGLAMPVGIVLVYTGAKYLVEPRWALFAAALFALAGSVIRWGIHLIPTSLGLLFFLAILALVLRLFRVSTRTRDGLVVVTLFLAMVLTHQVSSFILTVFLLACGVTQYVLKTGIMNPPDGSAHALGASDVEPIEFGGYVVFNLGFLTLTWSLTPYYGRPFLETAFIFLYESIGGGIGEVTGAANSGGGAAASPTLAQFVVANFDVLGFLLFLFGTTIGCLYALRRGRTNQAVLSLVVAVVVMTGFTLGPPLAGIGTFLSGRWFAFLYAVMAILTAVGFSYLRRGLSPALLLVFLLVFLYVFPMAMIASPKGTVDQPVLETERPRYSFTEEELAAMRTIGTTTTPGETGRVYTDFPYTAVYNRVHGERYRAATVPPDGPAQEDELLYREYQTTGAPLFPDGEGGQRIYRVHEDRMCPSSYDTVYANGDVTYCRAV
ncbi:hypothetical protein [Halorarius litoreus]|uniref:hypothetical protein n=1 Tax=Halorarius litoreus TaxID=2962676 RepID=UPI0020CF22DD|nr:hypothetical protein [Halorarius litoreus]